MSDDLARAAVRAMAADLVAAAERWARHHPQSEPEPQSGPEKWLIFMEVK